MAISNTFFFFFLFSLHIWRATLAHLFPKEINVFLYTLGNRFYISRNFGEKKKEKKKKKTLYCVATDSLTMQRSSLKAPPVH